MFGIFKKKNKDFLSPLLKWLSEYLAPLVDMADTRLRFRGRMRMLNNKARKNPKYLIWVFWGVMLVIFSLDLLVSCVVTSNKETTPHIEKIANLTHTFEGMQKISKNKIETEYRVKEINEYKNGIVLELDSLMKLENKTHEDTLRIINLYEVIKDNNPKNNSENAEQN